MGLRSRLTREVVADVLVLGRHRAVLAVHAPGDVDDHAPLVHAATSCMTTRSHLRISTRHEFGAMPSANFVIVRAGVSRFRLSISSSVCTCTPLQSNASLAHLFSKVVLAIDTSSRRQRHCRPAPRQECTAYHQTGPSGLPLAPPFNLDRPHTGRRGFELDEFTDASTATKHIYWICAVLSLRNLVESCRV